MAFSAIKGNKGTPRSVPTPPENASFVLGSRPGVLRSPPMARIKPAKPAGLRNYSKEPPLDGDTGTSGLS